MFLTDLGSTLRAEGLTVIEEPGWMHRTTNKAGLIEVRTIMLHHTAGPAKGNYPSLKTVRDGRPDVPGPLAQIGLARDGSVYLIAAGRANHAGKGAGHGMPTDGGAGYSIGIEAESTGYGDWTAAQLDAYPRLVAALCRRYGVPVERVIGHKEWARPKGRKIDPAGWPGDMNGFRSTVATLLGQKYRPAKVKVRTTLAAIAAAIGLTVASLVAVNPGTEPTSTVTPGQVIQVPREAIIEPTDPVEPVTPPPPPSTGPSAPSTSTGSGSGVRWSAATEGHQRQLNRLGYGLAVDGYKGPATTDAIEDVQRRCGIAVDGHYGPDTTRCVNNLVAAKAAGSSAVVKYGDRGAKVVTLQQKLNRLGYGLAVDGSAGPATIGAVYDVQVRCGLARDRVAGPHTQACINNLLSVTTIHRVLNVGDHGNDVRAVQARVGAKVDGHFGWETYGKVLRFQRNHGLERDGHVGPITTRALGLVWRG